MNSIAPPFFIFYPETPSFARNVLFTFHRGYFHKSWNAPTAKYSCPQLRTITITRSTHYPSCILLRYHVQPRAYCITFDAICPHFRPTCLFEISNHDPSSFVKFDGTIRLDGILFYHLIFCHFFFFLTEIHEKPCGSHKASLLSGARSTCIEYFFFLSMCSLLNINPGLLQETTI